MCLISVTKVAACVVCLCVAACLFVMCESVHMFVSGNEREVALVLSDVSLAWSRSVCGAGNTVWNSTFGTKLYCEALYQLDR